MKKNHTLLFVILLFCFSFFLVSFFQIETDYFWHIKAGEKMIQTGLLRHDVFSWFVQGKYWMSHEWLFEVILFFLKSVFGKIHVYIYSFLSMGFILFLLFFPNREKIYKNIPFGLFYLIFFFFLFVPFNQARPHLLSYILFIIHFYCYYDLFYHEDSKKVFILPLLSIIWANIHGGSSNLGYLLSLLFIVAGCFSFRFSKIEAKRITKKQFYKYFTVMILCMIGVCINIHGVKMFLYPYTNIMDTTMINNISEWRSTTLHDRYHYLFFMYLLFILFTFLFSKKKISFLDFMIFLFGTYLGLKSIRFWTYPYMMMTPIIFSYVSSREIDKGTNSVIAILSLFFLVSGIFLIKQKGNILYQFNFTEKEISIIKKENPKRLFNMYDYGGELIYHDIPVFIDGRADLYGKYNYKDYLAISKLEKNTVSLIKKYQFDYFLVSKDYPIYVYLENSNQVERIYSNKKMAFYRIKDFS